MRTCVFVLATFVASAAAPPVFAQATDTRSVGRKGAKQLSLSFATITQMAGGPDITADLGTQTTTSMFGALDVGHFFTERFVLSFGFSGSGTVARGSTPQFYSNAGGVLYFTPRRVSSAYIGGEVSTLLTRVQNVDVKPEVFGKLGVQTAIKENASFFVEGAYGGPVGAFATSGSLRTRVGLRVLF